MKFIKRLKLRWLKQELVELEAELACEAARTRQHGVVYPILIGSLTTKIALCKEKINSLNV